MTDVCLLCNAMTTKVDNPTVPCDNKVGFIDIQRRDFLSASKVTTSWHDAIRKFLPNSGISRVALDGPVDYQRIWYCTTRRDETE